MLALSGQLRTVSVMFIQRRHQTQKPCSDLYRLTACCNRFTAISEHYQPHLASQVLALNQTDFSRRSIEQDPLRLEVTHGNNILDLINLLIKAGFKSW